MMKTITYNNREFLYNITTSEYDRFVVYYNTSFYDPKPVTRMVKKYLLFGDRIRKTSYTCLFTLDYSIEDKLYSKEDVRKDIGVEVALIDRQIEIDNGEIIDNIL